MASEADILTLAERIGYQHGRNSGSWVTDGNSSDADRRAVIRAAEDGELETPEPLSGEWADSPTPASVRKDLSERLGCSIDADLDIETAYEIGFQQGYEDQAVSDAKGSLSS